jgi:hypothetical protein
MNKLSSRAIEELCRRLHAIPVVYRPRTDTERKQLDDLMAITPVRFGLRDEKERKQYADDMAAAAAAAVRKRLLNPPSEEEQLNQEVWLVLKLLLGEPLRGEGDPNITYDGEKPPMLQSEKLHRRWCLVAALHKKRDLDLSWEGAYEEASLISEKTPWAGTELTMKHAYVTVQRIRRTIEREREAQAKRASQKLPALT